MMNNYIHDSHYSQYTVLQKQIRFLNLNYPGISYYKLQKGMIQTENCTMLPELLNRIILPKNHIWKSISHQYTDAVLKIISLRVMEYGLSEKDSRLIKILKKYTYNQNISFVRELDQNQKDNYQDDSFRKIFVQFYYLMAQNQFINKVQKFVSQNWMMAKALPLLFKAIIRYENPQLLSQKKTLKLKEYIEFFGKILQLKIKSIWNQIYQICDNFFIAQDQFRVFCSWVTNQQIDTTLDSQYTKNSVKRNSQQIHSNYINENQQSADQQNSIVSNWNQRLHSEKLGQIPTNITFSENLANSNIYVNNNIFNNFNNTKFKSITQKQYNNKQSGSLSPGKAEGKFFQQHNFINPQNVPVQINNKLTFKKINSNESRIEFKYTSEALNQSIPRSNLVRPTTGINFQNS